MAAACLAAWTTFQVMLLMPSTHAYVSQHNKSRARNKLEEEPFDIANRRMPSTSAQYCLYIVTDSGWGNNAGDLIVSVAAGAGFVQEASGYLSGIVLSKCYDNPVSGVKLQGPTTDGWMGSLTYSTDGGVNYAEMYCSNCHRGSGSNPIYVDGDSSATGCNCPHDLDALTQCIPGTECLFTQDPPTPSAGAAVGDPHLRNMYGERFDLLKEGKSVLISIPRGKVGKDLLLAVEATALSLGGQCADTYFQALNITGAWANRVKPGGLRFVASSASDEEPKWTKFGPLDLKVVIGRTAQGTRYLNFYVKNLGRAGFDVGGLLGSDDHSEASTPTQACIKSVALSSRQIMNDGPKGQRASVAEAAI